MPKGNHAATVLAIPAILVGLGGGDALAESAPVTSISAVIWHHTSADVVRRWRYDAPHQAPEVVASGSLYPGLCSDHAGNLYVAAGGLSSRVDRFSAPIADPGVFIPSAGGTFRAMTVTPAGDLLVMETSGVAYLRRFDSAGVFQQTLLTLEGADRYVDLEVGPDGLGYAVRNNTSALSSAIDVFDLATGAPLGQTVLSPALMAEDMTIGPDGTIYLVRRGNSEVYTLSPVAGSTPAFLGVAGGFASGGIAMGPDGHLYVASGPDIQRMTITGVNLGIFATLSDDPSTAARFGRLSFGNLFPCPADLNADGLVDFADYLDFLTLFDASDARADFNRDGLVDFADYLEFLTRYDGGC